MTEKHDVGNDEAVARSERRAQLKYERLVEYVRQVLDTGEGRGVLWALLEEAGIYAQSWCGDANETIFREGKRYIGLKLMEQIFEANPAAYAQMKVQAEAEAGLDDMKERETNA